MAVTDTAQADLEAQVGAYAERLFETGLAALEAITISLGRELGLYEHLTDDGGVNAGELAQAAGIDARYAQEWLEQQAAAGLIDVTAAGADADQRRFGLSLAAQECLLRPESLASVGPLFDLLPAVNRVYPGQPRRRLPHRRRHPLCRLRLPRRPRRLQPARLREPPRFGLAAADPRPHGPSPRQPAPGPRRSAAARAGPRSPWPGRSPSCASTATTTTTRLSPRPASTPPKAAWATGPSSKSST